MSVDDHSFVDQLLALPATERGDLASILLRSLTSHPGEELSPAEWEQEIARRSDELNSGSAESLTAEESIAEARVIIQGAKKS